RKRDAQAAAAESEAVRVERDGETEPAEGVSDGIVQSVADDDQLREAARVLDELSEVGIDLHRTEEVGQRIIVALDQRDLRGHALPGVDFAAHPLLFDALPLGIGKTFQKRVNRIGGRDGTIEINDEQHSGAVARDETSHTSECGIPEKSFALGRRHMIAPVIAARALMLLAFALPSLSGMRLDEAMTLLQHQGLTIVYSNALVKPEMRVEREPQAATPRGKLDEILAPHGLRAVEGPNHELLVVAGRPPSPPPPEPPEKMRFDEEIVGMPSHTRILNEPPAQSESLSGEELNRIPNPSEDVARAVQHLPGITGAEASAAVNIRGGNADETIIAIDGLELSEPFHLKDFFNIFSTLDSSAMGRVDLMTGTFPAEWGDRMGGVIDMTLLTPAAPEASSITAGTLNARITSSGTTADRDTSWLATVRSWYPDIIFSVDKDPSELINTDCYDLLGKVEHRFTSQTTAAVTFLGSFDSLGYHSIKPDETVRSMAEETSAHVWLTAQTKWSDSASVRTILAVGRLWRDREGSISGDDIL